MSGSTCQTIYTRMANPLRFFGSTDLPVRRISHLSKGSKDLPVNAKCDLDKTSAGLPVKKNSRPFPNILAFTRRWKTGWCIGWAYLPVTRNFPVQRIQGLTRQPNLVSIKYWQLASPMRGKSDWLHDSKICLSLANPVCVVNDLFYPSKANLTGAKHPRFFLVGGKSGGCNGSTYLPVKRESRTFKRSMDFPIDAEHGFNEGSTDSPFERKPGWLQASQHSPVDGKSNPVGLRDQLICPSNANLTGSDLIVDDTSRWFRGSTGLPVKRESGLFKDPRAYCPYPNPVWIVRLTNLSIKRNFALLYRFKDLPVDCTSGCLN